MANPILNIDTCHADMIHDAQLDYYANKLATCSSDRSIKIFNVVGEQEFEHVANLAGHGGPVWEVSWAHPKFGVLLASCSHDKKVIIHREETPNKWIQVYTYEAKSSVNSIAWGPHEYDLNLACASSDGKVTILVHNPDNSWTPKVLDDCAAGVNSVTWAPYGAVGSMEDGVQVRRVATGGCDDQVRIWLQRGNGEWEVEHTLQGHTDWVRDVAFAPSVGLAVNILASCSEDGKVLIWKQTEAGGKWESIALPDFKNPVWRVSWSVTGNILAVSSGDATVTLWKESLNRDWVQVSAVNDAVNGTFPPEQ